MDKNRWVGSLRYIGIGWYIATCIVVGILAGVWLDGKVGLAPLFTLVGLFLGLAAAFWGVYRTLFPTRKS